jgi:hypothetical protein
MIHCSPFYAGCSFKDSEPTFPSEQDFSAAVIVNVDRVRNRVLDGSVETWLKIWIPGSKSLAQRIPTPNDKHAICEGHPQFFNEWLPDPSTILCLALRRDGDWIVLTVYRRAEHQKLVRANQAARIFSY